MTGIRVFVGCALIGLALSACATAGENASDATKARAADRTGDQEAADPSAQAGGGGRPAKSQEPRTRIFGFEGDNENTLPEGFQVGMTGTWKATEWSVRRVEGDKALAHIGFWDEDPDDVFPVCWVKDSRALDLTLTVRLFPVAPPRRSGKPFTTARGSRSASKIRITTTCCAPFPMRPACDSTKS
jgi:hypothetical protein